MNIKKTKLASLAVLALGVTGFSAQANAATYEYTGEIQLCTMTCNSFTALSVGSTVTGTLDIDVMANDTFGDADLGGFSFLVLNPAEPIDDTNPNPALLNPLPLLPGVAAVTGSGTTDGAGEIVAGELDFEFLVPPFSDNQAHVIFDLTDGSAQVCILFDVLGCVPGGTVVAEIQGSFSLVAQPVPVPAAVWLFGSALLGLFGVSRRKA